MCVCVCVCLSVCEGGGVGVVKEGDVTDCGEEGGEVGRGGGVKAG